jgi:HSP20 family protein
MALNPYHQHLFHYPKFGMDIDPFANVLDDPTDNLLWMPVIPHLHGTSDMNLVSSSPGYEISYTDGGNMYHISMDLPGVHASDINVNVEQDGNVLLVHGGRNHIDVSKDGTATCKSVSRFEKRFTIGNTVDMDCMSANLDHGVLTLSAPVKKEHNHNIRTIAITTKST